MTKQEAKAILRDTPIDIRSAREDDIHTKYATAQLIAIECIEKCEHLVGDTLEIVGEYVDDCICVYDFEMFGRNVPMIPVETVHQLLDRIEEESKRKL